MTAQLLKCPLFAGIEASDLAAMLGCLSAVKRQYSKGSFVFSAGDAAAFVGIVLFGRVHILKEDFWGNRTILSEITPPQLFGEAFACAGETALPVSAMVVEDSEILMLDYRRMVATCSSACSFHTAFIKNMMLILAQRNRALVEKMEHITRRTTREKLLSYLSEQVKRQGTNAIDIPFDRQELADYLAVERSALSAELSKMRDAGLLRFHKNHFVLLGEGVN
ncbi:MAG: Crp/Fnr family transcriptional regulator [Oscillospiraceae bacterium]|jgi:CRP-like cAMP-binding protein|nr:Crp/Fnr family transcriptional regulator [Oscillospiraceae bacterium]